MTMHAYLPTTIISDLVSQKVKEVAEVLRATLQHTTTKHAQTTGMLQKTHASIKKALMIEKCKTKINVVPLCQHCSPKL